MFNTLVLRFGVDLGQQSDEAREVEGSRDGGGLVQAVAAQGADLRGKICICDGTYAHLLIRQP
jgi:hypothetical protein